ncbi:MAG: methylated-DNA--[protein]-cysteine S-methyltransferase [Candidatus Bathyarchaeota archaeon]|nr:methylated-DNA--[protein]-cysteine S-methyltransferase [Candidatus Bathyarchaeota archaeon]
MINLQIQKIEGLWCGVALESKRIFATTFAFNEKDALKSLLKELPYNTIFQAAQKKNALAEEVLRTIRAIFYGEDVSFSFQFAMTRLSDYAKRVLELTSLIPTGYVTTYGVLAKAAGGSPRSVGGVMATNPFAPLVPCHRVVAADMTLGGYGGGLKTKWGILQRENRKYEKVVKAEINIKTLKLFPVDMLKPGKY